MRTGGALQRDKAATRAVPANSQWLISKDDQRRLADPPASTGSRKPFFTSNRRKKAPDISRALAMYLKSGWKNGRRRTAVQLSRSIRRCSNRYPEPSSRSPWPVLASSCSSPVLRTAIRQMQRTLTLIDMVSNGLTISDAKLSPRANFPSVWTEIRKVQATLERRSIDMRLVRLSMLIGRPMR